MNWKDFALNRYRVGIFRNGTFNEFKVDKLPAYRVSFKVALGVRKHMHVFLRGGGL